MGELRQRGRIWWIRYYRDGRVRPVRLNVNDFVGSHVERKAAAIAIALTPHTVSALR